MPAACAAEANSSPNAISGFGFASRKNRRTVRRAAGSRGARTRQLERAVDALRQVLQSRRHAVRLDPPPRADRCRGCF